MSSQIYVIFWFQIKVVAIIFALFILLIIL